MSVVGKGMLALAIIWVHITMANERRIDEKVIRAFHKETAITILGFILIFIGYLIEVQALGGFVGMTECEGAACAALLNAAG